MNNSSAAGAAPFEKTAEAPTAANIAALSSFAHFCMRMAFDECEADGSEIQDEAARLGIIVEVEGGYDPDKHGEHEYANPGDEWFDYADWFKTLRCAQKAREIASRGVSECPSLSKGERG